jgi:hypothetical protein
VKDAELERFYNYINRYSEKVVKEFGEVSLGEAGDVAGTIVRGGGR